MREFVDAQIGRLPQERIGSGTAWDITHAALVLSLLEYEHLME